MNENIKIDYIKILLKLNYLYHIHNKKIHQNIFQSIIQKIFYELFQLYYKIY